MNERTYECRHETTLTSISAVAKQVTFVAKSAEVQGQKAAAVEGRGSMGFVCADVVKRFARVICLRVAEEINHGEEGRGDDDAAAAPLLLLLQQRSAAFAVLIANVVDVVTASQLALASLARSGLWEGRLIDRSERCLSKIILQKGPAIRRFPCPLSFFFSYSSQCFSNAIHSESTRVDVAMPRGHSRAVGLRL